MNSIDNLFINTLLEIIDAVIPHEFNHFFIDIVKWESFLAVTADHADDVGVVFIEDSVGDIEVVESETFEYADCIVVGRAACYCILTFAYFCENCFNPIHVERVVVHRAC